MSSVLYTLTGWPSSPSSDNTAHQYGNDTGLWDSPGAPTNTGFTGQVAATSTSVRQEGGWDGSYWYVIGPDGKLYRYNPVTTTWSAALFAGAAIVNSTPQTQNWCMCSDGRFVYILSGVTDFIRYDPVNDTVQAMPSIPGSAFGSNMFLDYDGSDTIYGFKGALNTTDLMQKFTISTAAWTALPAYPAPAIGPFQGVYPAFLQGSLWVIYQDRNFTNRVIQFNGTTWTAKATTATDLSLAGSYGPSAYYGEVTDATIRLWPRSSGGVSLTYNVLSDTFANTAAPPFSNKQGGNWAVSRLFTPGYTYYEADGVTLLNPTKNLLAVAVGGSIQAQIKVKTAVDRGAGATVSVPTLAGTDAEDPVTICATAGGTYASSFVTGALLAGGLFDVFIRIVPTSAQTLGLTKLWNLRVV